MLETFATCEVFDRGLRALRVKTDELNKRAARHGMVPLEVTVVKTKGFVPVTRHYRDTHGRDGRIIPAHWETRFGHTEDLHTVEINGEAPRINGWVLACRVEFNGTIGNVVRIAPGRDDDGSYVTYREIEPVCEHCNTRRRRNDVFVLEHESGERKIVGRNCLADFLRCAGADALPDWRNMPILLAGCVVRPVTVTRSFSVVPVIRLA
jgi:hypothetical protein